MVTIFIMNVQSYGIDVMSRGILYPWAFYVVQFSLLISIVKCKCVWSSYGV